jgi:hypothetical protein
MSSWNQYTDEQGSATLAPRADYILMESVVKEFQGAKHLLLVWVCDYHEDPNFVGQEYKMKLRFWNRKKQEYSHGVLRRLALVTEEPALADTSAETLEEFAATIPLSRLRVSLNLKQGFGLVTGGETDFSATEAEYEAFDGEKFSFYQLNPIDPDASINVPDKASDLFADDRAGFAPDAELPF